MAIKVLLLSTLLLSTSALSATPQTVKSPAKLSWSSEEEENNCIGNFCAKYEDSKKPGMFDKVDKADRQRMKDPFASNDSDNGGGKQTLSFSFGDNN